MRTDHPVAQPEFTIGEEAMPMSITSTDSRIADADADAVGVFRTPP